LRLIGAVLSCGDFLEVRPLASKQR